PTNLEVVEGVRDQFPSFYASLFDRTISGHPRAVVTEYAWTPGGCDPCPVAALKEADLDELGRNALAYGDQTTSLTLTRLHARYTPDTLGEDLVFRQAPPIEGGREAPGARNSTGAHVSLHNNTFQARYIIRHPWTGEVACSNP